VLSLGKTAAGVPLTGTDQTNRGYVANLAALERSRSLSAPMLSFRMLTLGFGGRPKATTSH
jgi:hypothetical protein